MNDRRHSQLHRWSVHAQGTASQRQRCPQWVMARTMGCRTRRRGGVRFGYLLVLQWNRIASVVIKGRDRVMYVGHCRSISAVAGILVIILNAPCRAEFGPVSLMVGDSPVLLRLKSLLLRRGKALNFTVCSNYSRCRVVAISEVQRVGEAKLFSSSGVEENADSPHNTPYFVSISPHNLFIHLSLPSLPNSGRSRMPWLAGHGRLDDQANDNLGVDWVLQYEFGEIGGCC